eukprot:10452771-Alexandrium_andersonii.AAC.1
MSASLVGSEMCIRDRAWCTTKGWFRRLQSRLGVFRQLSALSGDAERPYAVSYTHLTLPTICSV